MTSHSPPEVGVLNELLEVTRDSVAGYREAAADAHNPDFRAVFQQRAEDRQHIVERLSEAIVKLGGHPVGEGSLLAAAHRVFLNLREKVSSGDDAIVQEVERGEDFIKSKYESALAGPVLSDATKDIVRTAYGSVWSGHEEAASLKSGRRNTRPNAM